DRDQDQDLEEEREVVEDEHAPEDRPRLPRGLCAHDREERAGDPEREYRQEPEEILPALVEEDRDREEQQPRRRQEQLRRQEQPVGGRDVQGFAAFSATAAGAGDVAPPTACTAFSDGARSRSKTGLG